MIPKNEPSSELLNAIDVLLSGSTEFVFGGSLGLKALGVLDREVKDLDVVIRKDLPIESYGFGRELPSKKDLGEPRMIKDESGNDALMYTIFIGSICVDIFPVDKIESSIEDIAGRSVRIQKLEDTLSAKRAWINYYEKRIEKHKKDICEIEKNTEIPRVK